MPQPEFIGEANGFVPFNDFGSGDVPMDQKYVDLWASQNKSLVRRFCWRCTAHAAQPAPPPTGPQVAAGSPPQPWPAP